MPSTEDVWSRTGEEFSKDSTVFMGLVVRGALDAVVLKRKAEELVLKWPVLGGEIIRTKFPYTVTTGSNLDFQAKSIPSDLVEYFPIDFKVSKSDEDHPSYHNCDPGADAIFHFDSMTYSSLPGPDVLGIRVTVLNDATLIGFRASHYVCNAESLYAIVEAYTHLISGNKISDLAPPSISKVPRELPPTTLTAQSTSISTGNALVLSPDDMHALGTFTFIWWVILYLVVEIWERLGLPNSSYEKYIFISDKLIDRWRDQCQRDIDQAHKSDGDVQSHDPTVKLSKLDVLVSWHIQNMFAEFPARQSPHPVNLIYPFSNRTSTPQKTLTSSPKMLGNSQYHLSIQFSSQHDLQTQSHSSVARSIRLAVLQTRKPETIQAYASFWKTHHGHLMTLGPRGSKLKAVAVVSSWANLRFEELDFRGALIEMGRNAQVIDGSLGKVIFTHPTTLGPLGVASRPLTFVVRDSRLGGYWLRSRMYSSSWKGHENRRS